MFERCCANCRFARKVSDVDNKKKYACMDSGGLNMGSMICPSHSLKWWNRNKEYTMEELGIVIERTSSISDLINGLCSSEKGTN